MPEPQQPSESLPSSDKVERAQSDTGPATSLETQSVKAPQDAEGGLSRTGSRPEMPEGSLRGWLAAAGSAAILFCTFGYVNAFGIYQEYYFTHQLRGYSHSTISWIGSVQVFWQFAGGAISGPLFDRYGTVSLIPGSVGYVLSILFTSLCTRYYQFFLAQSILGGICIGLLFSPSLAIISHYFEKKRGTAMGLVVAGSSLGGVIFPIVLNRLLYVEQISFGWAVRVCALIVLVLLSFAVAVMRSRLRPSKHPFDFALLWRPTYILTVTGIWLMSWGMYIPFFYLPSFALKVGMSPQLAPYMVAVLNGTSLFGRIGAGVVADRLGRFNMLTAMAICSGVLMFCWPAIHTSAGIVVFSAFVGFFVGAIVSLLPACVAEITPHTKYIGAMTGISMFIWSFAGLSGPPISGAIIGHDGDFASAGLFGGAVFVGGAAILFAGRLAAEPRLSAKL